VKGTGSRGGLPCDGLGGLELWTSDGTYLGTSLVRDIAPGAASSRPHGFAAAGSLLFFAADDGSSGTELWQSDGTAAGTRRVHDVAPGAASSNPRDLTLTGDRLYFAADDGIHGEEPWSLALEGAGCVPTSEALCLGGRFRVVADWKDFQGHRGVCLNKGRFAVEALWTDFQGNQGEGQAVPLAGGDTGYFWFFDAGNVEVVLKVLDGRAFNHKFWVFYGALSNVEYTLTVTDTVTGTVKTYTNPTGRLASVADTGAF